MVKGFDYLSFTYMARSRKQFADALETLASMLEIPSGVEVRPIEVEQRDEASYCNQVEREPSTPDGLPWFSDIKRYFEDRSFPPDAS